MRAYLKLQNASSLFSVLQLVFTHTHTHTRAGTHTHTLSPFAPGLGWTDYLKYYRNVEAEGRFRQAYWTHTHNNTHTHSHTHFPHQTNLNKNGKRAQLGIPVGDVAATLSECVPESTTRHFFDSRPQVHWTWHQAWDTLRLPKATQNTLTRTV